VIEDKIYVFNGANKAYEPFGPQEFQNFGVGKAKL